ncbi:MAG: hypothetical protein P0Y49_07725 [Candidatus Pedobacter colombiensis]|uniref:Uncharacterized protein n=1 Tax=Candidatus Pedobacter colombiensis TaxID=3121371 RepID=A0AAJ5WE93_9SPHI|nr:hypothetical protein [Pedobacter sp.]WEK21027.1 MAG: hypothetical protein P0Y49_07725 [Pedobacter sp.]
MNHKKPLYRKENKVSLSNKYNVSTGSEYRYHRHSKAFLNDDRNHKSMTSGKYGYDYTPLFKFLLSKVGSDWDQIYAEAKARLNDPAPIFWMVAMHESERRNLVRLGESTYYSGLFVNEDGKLTIVNPNVSSYDFPDPYPGETLSFNGIVIDKTGSQTRD